VPTLTLAGRNPPWLVAERGERAGSGARSLRSQVNSPMFAISLPTPRQLLVWSLVAQQLLMNMGASLPGLTPPVDPAERYPCEHCRCGCRSAEQCWRQCCCYTNEQKLAWARQHGVAAPAFVVAACSAEAGPRRARCRHCPPRAESLSQAPYESRSSGSGHQRPSESRPSTGVCWLAGLACQGLYQHWQAAGAGWPGDWPVQVDLALPPLGRIEPMPFLGSLLPSPSPPTPPPKANPAGYTGSTALG
jgi:hypothetical protein